MIIKYADVWNKIKNHIKQEDNGADIDNSDSGCILVVMMIVTV